MDYADGIEFADPRGQHVQRPDGAAIVVDLRRAP
jgi:hypothetical protein